MVMRLGARLEALGGNELNLHITLARSYPSEDSDHKGQRKQLAKAHGR